MEIRKATTQDIQSILLLEKSIFSDPWSESSLSSQIEEYDSVNLVLEENSKIIGYILGRTMTPEAEIYRIASEQSSRKKGVGTALLLAFQVEAKCSFGVTSFFLEVRESNLIARHLYEKNGYTEDGMRKNYYQNPKENAILYSMTIKEEL